MLAINEKKLSSNNEVILKRKDAVQADIVVGICEQLGVSVVWNGLLHRLADVIVGQTHKYTFTRSYYFLRNHINDFNAVYPVYKALYGSNRYEKVLIVKMKYMEQFMRNPFAHLLPDENDPNYKDFTIYALPGMATYQMHRKGVCPNFFQEQEREKYSCSKIERDYRFRELVFGKYSTPHCIICGLEHLNTLQAAHIIAVQDGGDDIPENGIVLCANHHLMYDAKDFEIDFSTGEIKVKNNAAKKYMSFESNNGSILK